MTKVAPQESQQFDSAMKEAINYIYLSFCCIALAVLELLDSSDPHTELRKQVSSTMCSNSSHMSGLSNNPAGARYSCQHLQRTNQFGEVRGQIHMELTLGFGLEEDIN